MASGLIDIMKRTSMDAMHNAQMCDLRYGTVVSEKPLKIQVTNMLTLPERMLVVPEHLTDYEVEVTINWNTENHTHSHPIMGECSAESNTHRHGISGKKKMIVHGALKVGHKVALLRKQGGQSYFVLDRLDKLGGD